MISKTQPPTSRILTVQIPNSFTLSKSPNTVFKACSTCRKCLKTMACRSSPVPQREARRNTGPVTYLCCFTERLSRCSGRGQWRLRKREFIQGTKAATSALTTAPWGFYKDYSSNRWGLAVHRIIKNAPSAKCPHCIQTQL